MLKFKTKEEKVSLILGIVVSGAILMFIFYVIPIIESPRPSMIRCIKAPCKAIDMISINEYLTESKLYINELKNEIYDLEEKSNRLPDTLSEEQIKLMEDAGIDTTSTFLDARFPDGRSMFEWACKYDLEFTKINYPDDYQKCVERGYIN